MGDDPGDDENSDGSNGSDGSSCHNRDRGRQRKVRRSADTNNKLLSNVAQAVLMLSDLA